MAFTITSTAFAHQETIPNAYTCDGADVSPPLAWTDPPAGTKSVALICDDPDAPVGTWVHWVLYNVPATSLRLAENLPKGDTLKDGSKQGLNDFRRIGYGGPCPPRGPAHRYFFKLYALDSPLELPPKATKAQLERAMQGHLLAQAELIGRYQR
jgi:Raf kinase inhibitor-like YbhB/YbcL family protein